MWKHRTQHLHRVSVAWFRSTDALLKQPPLSCWTRGREGMGLLCTHGLRGRQPDIEVHATCHALGTLFLLQTWVNIPEKISHAHARNKICQTTCCGISGQCSWSTLSRLEGWNLRWGPLVFIDGALRNPLYFYTISYFVLYGKEIQVQNLLALVWEWKKKYICSGFDESCPPLELGGVDRSSVNFRLARLSYSRRSYFH